MRRCQLLALLTTILLIAPLTSIGPANAAAQWPSPPSTLYSPDLSVFPDASSGYPRAVRLIHSGSSQTILATFAKERHQAPTSLPIYTSSDAGATWTQISEIHAHHPGWSIEAPTLFEVPRDVPGLRAGDLLAAGTAWEIGDYRQQAVEVFHSQDKGETWSYLSSCTQTNALPNTWGHGIWEPAFWMGADGTLACYISDERPAQSVTNNQIIGHYTSHDGGKSWSSTIKADVAFPNDPLARPGMQTFAQLPDGRVAMSYEMCRDATDPDHACEAYLKISPDGLSWGTADDPGQRIETADHRELLHTPYITWLPSGGGNGTLVVTGQRVTAGPTGSKTVLDESGAVALSNTDLGQGPWQEMPLPIQVSPTGSYAPGAPACPGYSSPVIPLADGGSFLHFAATWLGRGNQCKIEVAQGELPQFTSQLIGPADLCLDVDTNTSRNGNRAQLWDCNEASGQRWSYGRDGSLSALGKCLDVDAQGTANHTKVQLWECNGSGAQRWVLRPDNSLFNPQSGKCLDDPQGSTSRGTGLQIYDCNGLWTQQWRIKAS